MWLLPAAVLLLPLARSAQYAKRPQFFCHPGVSDDRLRKNTTAAACRSLCDADARCASWAVTNSRVPMLRWCFAPEDDCPNPSGACVHGCENWDTYVKEPPPTPLPFNLSETLSSHMVLQQKPARAAIWGCKGCYFLVCVPTIREIRDFYREM
eukprot:SAG31_NODE_4096_length_3591_cov_2.039805_1_plen_153_part_00